MEGGCFLPSGSMRCTSQNIVEALHKNAECANIYTTAEAGTRGKCGIAKVEDDLKLALYRKRMARGGALAHVGEGIAYAGHYSESD